MVELADKSCCSGCAACHDICPRGAISMVADAEGFLYPQINRSLCVECGLCARTCPSLNRDLPRIPLAVYAAKAKDEALRLASSSGGVFSLLARLVLGRGGRVYGAAFDKTDWSVVHCGIDSDRDLDEFRGSKYLQSRTAGIYRQVKADLDAGHDVLFSGTPCQIAALKHFLGKPSERLICIDVVCHAVPSPLAWRKYLDERLTKTGPGAIIKRIAFRHKSYGWKRYSLSLRFANDKEYLADLKTDTFLRGFLSELYNRRSCHQCAAREVRSGADITLADYWRVHETLPELDDDKGTSLVLVHSEKGHALWQSLAGQVEAVTSTLADAVRTNPSIVRSAPASLKRAKFFKSLAKGKDFDWIVENLLHRPLWRRCVSFAKRILRKALGK